jgi:isoquinoline 1-oxidoreductase subunit alpha
MPEYKLRVNGKTHTVNAEADTPLLWVLRDNLELTGTKYGCGVNTCGACTVLINDRAVNSCMIPVNTCVSKEIITIEGLSEEGDHPVQQAWNKVNVSQCGYCQPGQIMTVAGMLKQHPAPDKKTIEATMNRVLCRCGTYQRIRQAIDLVVKERKA